MSAVGKALEGGKDEGLGRYVEGKDFILVGLRKKMGGERREGKISVVPKNSELDDAPPVDTVVYSETVMI